jgi:hypothetical protein
MRNFLQVSSMAALLLMGSALVAQNDAPATADAALSPAQAAPRQIRYFSLEHRSADTMAISDRDLLHTRKRELINEAQFYGYDITSGGWTYDQAICPQLPNVLLLHYLNKFPDGSESLFTALVPSHGNRVRIVPVLYRNAVPYTPAVRNPRNFAIFNALVPPDIAKKESGPDGKWLSLGVCYAEIVGGRPNVPNVPSLDTATIRAPIPTIQIDAGKLRRIEFSDRDSSNAFKVWTISLNGNGQLIAATNDDYPTYVASTVQPITPTGKISSAAPAPATTISSVAPQPPATISSPTPAPASTVSSVAPMSAGKISSPTPVPAGTIRSPAPTPTGTIRSPAPPPPSRIVTHPSEPVSRITMPPPAPPQ